MALHLRLNLFFFITESPTKQSRNTSTISIGVSSPSRSTNTGPASPSQEKNGELEHVDLEGLDDGRIVLFEIRVCSGTGDVVVLSRMAELAPTTRWIGLHGFDQRGKKGSPRNTRETRRHDQRSFVYFTKAQGSGWPKTRVFPERLGLVKGHVC